MGLFDFKKKKEIPLPPQPFSSQPAPSQSDLPKPTPPDGIVEKEEIDFDKLLAEVPPEMPALPPDFKSLGADFLKGQGKEQATPTEAQPQAQTPESDLTSRVTKEGFELPDFADEEIRRIAEARAAQIEVEKKPEPKPEPVPKPVAEEPVQWEVYPEPAPPRQPVIIKDKFMDINSFLKAKDEFDTIRKLMTNTQDMIEQHAIITNDKNTKYQALAESLNSLQDKIMLIDNKIFENP